MKRSIISILISFVVIISTCFLSGCVMEDNCIGAKFSYLDIDSSNDGFNIVVDNNFKTDILNNSYLLSKEILYSLSAEYGYGLPADTLISVGSNNYTAMYSGVVPFGSTNSTHYIVNNDTNHTNAIGNSFVNASTSYAWEWNVNSISTDPITYANAFVSLDNIEKLQGAILLISAGYDISGTTSSDYSKYTEYLASSNKQNELSSLIDSGKVYKIGLSVNQIEILKSFILTTIIGTNLVDIDNSLFEDINANDKFDSEECIVYENGTMLDASVYQDINFDNTFNYLSLPGGVEKRQLYFKNYTNTINAIVNNLVNATDIVAEENVLRYPVIIGLKYKDFSPSVIEPIFDEDDEDINFFFNGMAPKIYTNLVLMQEKDVEIDNVTLAIESEYDFSLSVYVRVIKNGVVACQGLLVRANIKNGTYADNSDDNTIELDLDELTNFSSNSELSEFINNHTASSEQSLSIDNYKYYQTTSIDGVKNVITYVDNSDYVEICFAQNVLVPYKIGFQILSYDELTE